MREILFRGKTEDNNEWQYGVPVPVLANTYSQSKYVELVRSIDYDELSSYIPSIDSDIVLSNTLGQFTGIVDKNGTKIFEGDICSTDLKRPYNIVKYSHGCFVYSCNDGRGEYEDIMIPLSSDDGIDPYTEVIGNIYDNPELLDKYGLKTGEKYND